MVRHLSHLKLGPPEDGGDGNVTDEGLGYMLLGCLRAVPHFKDFPIKVRGVVDNFDNEGTIESFTIITESGLGYTVSLTFEGQVDEDGNPE